MRSGKSQSLVHREPDRPKVLYLVDAWANECIIAEIATNVGGDDLAVNAITR